MSFAPISVGPPAGRYYSVGSNCASDRALARTGLALLIGILVAVCFATPGESAWLPPCVFYKFTGLYCPGCGSTRMLFYLIHGHPIEAFRYNPLSLLLLPLVLYGLVRKSIAYRLPALPHVSWRWTTAFTILLILFTVARNIPAEPFYKLAPGGIPRTHLGLQTAASLR